MADEGDIDPKVERLPVDIVNLKVVKSRKKAAFTRARNKLKLELRDDYDEDTAKSYLDTVESTMDEAIDSVQVLANAYKELGDFKEMTEVLKEIESFEQAYDEVNAMFEKALTDTDSTVDEKPDARDVDTNGQLGKDLWKQLQRVKIPIFTGDKVKYPAWKAAFYSCIDEAPMTAEYKLLQLRQYLGGEALKSIENLGHSKEAYQAAKERLERKFGGTRRIVNRFLEELESFPPIKHESAKELEKYSDLLDVAVINLKEVKNEDDLNAGALYHRLLKKLPQSTLTRYLRHLNEKKQTESVETLRTFINQETEYAVQALETTHGLASLEKQKPNKTFFGKNNSPQVNSATKQTCPVCGGHHKVYQCEEFKSMNVEARWVIAKQKALCFRCLRDGHRGGSCKLNGKCGINNCTKTHNRMLHREALNAQAAEFMPTDQSQPQTFKVSNAASNYVSLRTVPVVVKAGRKEITINALLDDGSTTSYLNEDVAAELGVTGEKETVEVNVLNGKSETLNTMNVSFILQSTNREIEIPMVTQTVREVTGKLEPVNWIKMKDQWPHLKDIGFPALSRRGKVDLLIGLDYAELHRSMGEIVGEQGAPVARLTPLGWTCVGPISSANNNSNYFTFHSFESDVNKTLKQFWEIEHVEIEKENVHLSPEDKKVQEFVDNHIEYQDNKYTVALPWKVNKETLNNNYKTAVSRLHSTEKKLQNASELKQEYHAIIKKYEEKGYVTKVKVEANEKAWYLPHFAVVRPEKQTTKVRIVFDASVKYDGVSLNDCLSAGPKLQRELFEVLLRFRKKPIAVICDIAEMYLRVGLAGDDQRYQRFLWRESPDRPIETYQFTCLVFGVNSSPYLAQYVSRYNAVLHAEAYPMAADTILNSTYMDDSMDSSENTNEAIELCRQLTETWHKAGMHPRKWLSNSCEVLESINEDDRAAEIDLGTGQLPTTKALGVGWQTKEDIFVFKVGEKLVTPNPMTKRNVLKTIARVFDPLGFLAPYVLKAKLIMQDIWLNGLSWDDEVTESMKQDFKAWCRELEHLSTIQVPRCLRNNQSVKSSSLHTFVDASSVAYGAVAYLRTEYESEGELTIRFVAAKSRVAPIESTSIPRLELLGAVLGLKLTLKICKALEIDIQKVTFWTDSLNVLFWIRNHSRQFKTFVANRIGEIHSTTKPEQWRHVPTQENPADHVSRGLPVAILATAKIWWAGPEFLEESEQEWPKNIVEISPTEKSERKKSAQNKNQTFHTTNSAESTLKPESYSSWSKFVRVYAWVIRFIENCRVKKEDRERGTLKVSEIEDSRVEIIRDTQRQYFKEEYDRLRKNMNVNSSSKLVKLNPRIDTEGLLRSDSRLRYAEYLPYSSRYPIILPRKSPVTELIVRDAHERNNHSGTNQTLSDLSVNYWIIAAREQIREWESTCAVCRRRKSQPSTQIMAPLPKARITMPIRAFSNVAVDYGGPYLTIQGRGKRREKRYLCLFTCLSTRAVHLEIAFGLDTNSFLNAFYRMTSRRGLPLHVYSDNGTNFVGADKELRELVSAMDKTKINDHVAVKGVSWHFNPPAAPHWGGVHEALIKSAKRAIAAILTSAEITDEELITACVGAEGLMNSRPLTYQSANASDCTPLTPNHFLFGQVGGQFAPESVDETTFNPTKRWRRVQELVRHFWKRWLKEFLPMLGGRKKWFQEKRDYRVGDVVLVVDPDQPRGHWPLGRITDVYPGGDGHVRAVSVRVGKHVFKRSVTRLCLIESSE